MKSNRKNKNYHNRIAVNYDNIYEHSVYWEYNRRITWEHLKPVLINLPNRDVLDLGCGTGYWGLKLMKSGFDVFFADLSQQMVNQVVQKLEETGVEWQNRVVCMDAMHTDTAFPDKKFSLVIAYGDILSFSENPEKVIQAVYHSLSEGGYFLANFDNRLANMAFYGRTRDWSGLLDFIETGRSRWLTRLKEQQFPLRAFYSSEMERLLTKRGFRICDFYSKPLLPVQDFIDDIDDKELFNKLIPWELRLSKDSSSLGCGNHIEFIAQKKRKD